MSTNTVSVIIPCYNGAAFLRKTLESALGQTHRPLEVIVVDDGSTDGSADIARSFGDPVKLITQKRQGAHVARRTGVCNATSDYVAFQDADDTVSRTRIEELVGALESQPGCIAAIGITANEHNATRTPEGELGIDDGSRVVVSDTLNWMLQKGAPIAGAMNLLVRRAEALAAFRPGAGMPAANDYDYQLCLATQGDFVLHRSVSCHYRPGVGGITHRGSNALQPAMAICAAVDVLRFCHDAQSRSSVFKRLSEIGPMFIWPLLREGKWQEATRLITLLAKYGSWPLIPRRLWWGFSKHEAGCKRDAG